MKNAERAFVRTLHALAAARGIGVTWHGDDWIAVLTRGGHRHMVMGYDLGLNTSSAMRIANDKGATFDVLRGEGLPAVEHRVFLHPRFAEFLPTDGTWPSLIAAFEAFGRDAVLKDNEGTGGTEVYRVGSQAELEQRALSLMQIGRSMALSPFLAVESERRFIMLEDEPLFAYGKERQAGEWRHNLGHGAKPGQIDPLDRGQVEYLALAREAMRALTLRFASIDLVTVAGKPMVLEANAGVMLEVASRPDMGGAGAAERIYGRALDLVYP